MIFRASYIAILHLVVSFDIQPLFVKTYSEIVDAAVNTMDSETASAEEIASTINLSMPSMVPSDVQAVGVQPPALQLRPKLDHLHLVNLLHGHRTACAECTPYADTAERERGISGGSNK